MSMCKMYFRLALVCALWQAHSDLARAEWKPESIRVSGGDCLVRESKVDESKFTILFFDFSVRLDGPSVIRATEAATCAFDVQFRIPPAHRLRNLSSRIFVTADKDNLSGVYLNAVISLNDAEFRQTGGLIAGSTFAGRTLLYKSFDARSVAGCLPVEQNLSLHMEIGFSAETEPGSRGALIDMTGQQDWIDLWLDVEAC